MKKPNMVRYKVDLKNPKPLNAEQLDRLRKLAEKPDEEIDYSDIPKLTGKEVWYRPGIGIAGRKKQITLRLDADILDYFKKTGERYQTRINAVLRQYVKAHS